MAANFHFSSRILLIIFLFIPNCCKLRQITQLLESAVFFSLFRLIFHQPAAAEQIILKMENGNHLEVAEFSKLNPNYMKSVKKVGLGKQIQVSGDFCVKQSVFLWMVSDYLQRKSCCGICYDFICYFPKLT